jgi:hypothetical protein
MFNEYRGLFLLVAKRQERGADHLPATSAEVKKSKVRIQLVDPGTNSWLIYIYIPFGHCCFEADIVTSLFAVSASGPIELERVRGSLNRTEIGKMRTEV